MDKLDDKQKKIKMLEFYHKNKSYSRAQREWRKTFKCSFHQVWTRWQIKNAVESFHKTGNITDQRKNNFGEVQIRSDVNIERVRQSVSQSPRKSLSRRSAKLGISRVSVADYDPGSQTIPLQDSHNAVSD